jgi:hypothetical protein
MRFDFATEKSILSEYSVQYISLKVGVSLHYVRRFLASSTNTTFKLCILEKLCNFARDIEQNPEAYAEGKRR